MTKSVVFRSSKYLVPYTAAMIATAIMLFSRAGWPVILAVAFTVYLMLCFLNRFDRRFTEMRRRG
jgi:cytosine/uracil/thiamine/allantoin permease